MNIQFMIGDKKVSYREAEEQWTRLWVDKMEQEARETHPRVMEIAKLPPQKLIEFYKRIYCRGGNKKGGINDSL